MQHTWYLVRYIQAPNRLYKSEVRGSLSRVKTPCEQGLPHCTHVLQAEQRLPHATEKAKRSFPLERGPTAKHHPACNPQCTQWFRAEEFPLLCPAPKFMPRFSIGDVGETRWPLSHGWTDTSPILPDAAHDSRNQGRVVSLSVLSLLSACVRLCQLREVHHSLLQAMNSWSRTQECSNRRVTCLLHISDVTRVRHAQGTTLSTVRAFIACAAAVQTAVLVLFGPSCPSCLGHYRPLQRRSASDKCSVRCRPIKQRDKIYRNF